MVTKFKPPFENSYSNMQELMQGEEKRCDLRQVLKGIDLSGVWYFHHNIMKIITAFMLHECCGPDPLTLYIDQHNEAIHLKKKKNSWKILGT